MKFYGRAAMAGMIWTWLASAGTELIWLPAAMITARLLNPADFGVVAIAAFFVALATRLTQFGFNAAILRMKELTDEHTSSIFVLTIVLGVASWLALLFSSPFIATFFESPATGQILPIAAMHFLVVPLGTVPGALLVRNLRYRQITYILWINSVTSCVVTIVLAFLGFGYWSLIYGPLAASATSSIAKMAYARWRPRFSFHLDAVRDTLSFGAGIYALRLVEYGALNLDSMAVGKMMGPTALGFYDKAFNLIARILDRLNQAGPTISFRVFAVIQDEQERFRRGYRKIVLSTTLVGYPLLTVLAFTAAPLFEILFGRPWVESALPFQILCAAGGLKTLNSYAASAIEAAGRVWAEVWRQAIYALLVLIGVASLRAWGTPGAATAVLGATIVMTVLMHELLHRVTPLTWRDMLAPQVPALACSAGLALCLAGAQRVLATTDLWVQLVVPSLLSAMFFAGFLYFVPSRPVQDLIADVLEHVLPAARNALGLKPAPAPVDAPQSVESP